MNKNNNCIWIGIGIDIRKTDPLYGAIENARNILNVESALLSEAHINLYDLSVPQENIDTIQHLCEEIAHAQKNFVVRTGKVNYFDFGVLFFEIEKNEILSSLHKNIVMRVSEFKGACIDDDYLSPVREYTPTQRSTLEKYGNPYVLDEFHPHITIGRAREAEIETCCQKLSSQFIPFKYSVNALNIVIKNNTHKTAYNFRRG